MHPPRIPIPFLTAACQTFTVTVSACKCVGSRDLTRACCMCGAGVSTDTDDCPASKISERLSGFARCCRGFGAVSDCSCPVGCVLAETNPARIASGLERLSEAEAEEIAESHL